MHIKIFCFVFLFSVAWYPADDALLAVETKDPELQAISFGIYWKLAAEVKNKKVPSPDISSEKPIKHRHQHAIIDEQSEKELETLLGEMITAIHANNYAIVILKLKQVVEKLYGGESKMPEWLRNELVRLKLKLIADSPEQRLKMLDTAKKLKNFRDLYEKAVHLTINRSPYPPLLKLFNAIKANEVENIEAAQALFLWKFLRIYNEHLYYNRDGFPYSVGVVKAQQKFVNEELIPTLIDLLIKGKKDRKKSKKMHSGQQQSEVEN